VRKTIRVETFEGLSVLVMSVYNTHLNFTGVQTRISVRAALASSTPSNPLMNDAGISRIE
jgi:hypothetical protein